MSIEVSTPRGGSRRAEWMELGAAFRCADLGIPPEIRENHAAHVGHGLRVLKDDKRVILSAARPPAEYLNGLRADN